MLQEALRGLGEGSGVASPEAAGEPDHPDAAELAMWLDGVLPEDQAAQVEAHLAGCGECRALTVDVSSFQDPTEMEPPSVSFPKRPGVQWLAAAALILMTLVAFRGLTVDERLAELGVGPWSRWTVDRDILRSAVGLLDGRPGSPSPFAGFSAEEPSVRSGAGDPTLLISPRWEALSHDSVVWQWASPFQAVELWVVDDREQLVLRHPIDSITVREEGEARSYGPAPELGTLDPDRLYAWKLNFRDTDGRLIASDFIPFRRLSTAEIENELSSLPPFLAAAALSEIGAHGEALQYLAKAEGSALSLRQAVRTVMQRRRVPEDLLDQEVARWMRAEGR